MRKLKISKINFDLSLRYRTMGLTSSQYQFPIASLRFRERLGWQLVVHKHKSIRPYQPD